VSWQARLWLDYSQEQLRTVTRHRHEGPLRVLQSLYPEGDAVCHNVLVHPPGGLVGGDTLDIQITARGNSHGLITTPGATRFYRSEGPVARQQTLITLHDQSRLEWLPLEALCYSDCVAENQLRLVLAPEAECLGWDISALGLPHAQLPFERGSLLQHIEIPGVWLERGLIQAEDRRLMDGPLGLAGHRCLATLFFVSGQPITRERLQQTLELARGTLDGHPLALSAGVTSPHPQLIVLRVLSDVVEPAAQLLRQVWALWRAELWGLAATPPRVWAT
jgi:urease accessory protein